MSVFKEPSSVQVVFVCDSCRVNINGMRWRCTICPSFDLCNSCQNRSKWPSYHLGTHKSTAFHDYLADRKTMLASISFTCDVCHKGILNGLRIHCNNCMNFDLCAMCFMERKIIAPHEFSHTISAFQEPGSVPVPEYSTSQLSTNVGVKPTVNLASLSSSNSNYSSTKDLFLSTWTKDTHLKSKITIRAICQVENSVLNGSYDVYKSKLKSDNISPNKKLLWHGTGLQCNLYNNKFLTCHSSNCAVCNIVENNFILSRAQSNINFGRFGNGIYFSTCSSKSHDYNVKSENDSGVRAMLLCKVLVGKTYITKVNMVELLSPPRGFHSVTGEPGKDLNYPEVVIWEERAIVPKFIVFYSMNK